MNLRPFGSVKNCALCGTRLTGIPGVVSIRACVAECMRIGKSDFTDTTSLASEREPHSHVTCDRCGFTWLELPYDQSLVKDLW